MTPNSTPPERLSARRSAREFEKVPGVVGGEKEAQAGAQDVDPQAVTLDAISTALNAAGFEYGVGDEARAIVERVRDAAAIADATDVTDWQRGYRACADRVLAALQPEEQP